MTNRQKALALVVLRNMPAWYRAHTSGERVTLASLARADVLERRAWRGIAGSPDAAYEYRVSRQLLDLVETTTPKIGG